MRFKFGIKIGIVFAIFFFQLFFFTVKFFSILDEYEHFVHELEEEIEELDMVRNFQLAISSILMPANDFLIRGGDNDEPENFKALAAYTESLIGKLEKLHFDYAEEEKLMVILKKDYARIKALSLQIFAIPDARNSKKASRLMEKMDDIADKAIIRAGKLHQAVKYEINTYRKELIGVRESLNKIVLYGILFNAALIMLVIVYFRHSVFKPMLSLYEASIELGHGNLDTRVEVKSNDEIGRLCYTFNQMAEELQQAKQQTQQSSQDTQQQVVEETIN